MKKIILLTGYPGCGKTTLIKQIIPHLSPPVNGFYTREIRPATRSGKKRPRLGFELITLDGQRGVLAHVDPAQVDGRTTPRIGRYIVNLRVLDYLASPTLQQSIAKDGWVVLDEIGPMEILSKSFRQAVEAVIASQVNLLGTIVRRSTPFGDQIKAQTGVNLIEVSPHNREELLDLILSLISKE